MIRIAELMTQDVQTLNETDSIHDARDLMTHHKIRHIPVVDEQGFFIGLLTQRDLLKVSVSTFAEVSRQERDELETGIPLREVMVTDIVVADEETDLREAARYILDTKHGCLPVVNDGKVIGILTESDFVRLSLGLLDKLAAYENAGHA